MEMPIEIFKSEDGKIQVNVRIEGETAWLTQAAMAQLFGCTTENVLMHLKNIYADGELQDSATTKDFLVVRQEGTRQVSRQIKHGFSNPTEQVFTLYRNGTFTIRKFQYEAKRNIFGFTTINGK